MNLPATFDDLRASIDTGQRSYRKARMARWRAEEKARRDALKPPPLVLDLDGDEPAERKIPRRDQTAPVVAYRFARIVKEHDGWRFAALNDPFGTFAVEDEAVCKMRVGHKAPNLHCTCGFYALRDKPPLSQRVHAREWLLEVELYGTVIAHQIGYRAQFQRVRSLLAGFCWCEEPATMVVVSKAESSFPHVALYCAEHRPQVVPMLGFARSLGTEMQSTFPIEAGRL